MKKPPPLPTVTNILRQLLDRARRVQTYRWQNWTIGAVILVALVGVLGLNWPIWPVLLVLPITLLAIWLWVKEYSPKPDEVMEQIGEEHPDLRYLFVTAHEQEQTKEPGYLQQRVINEAVQESLSRKLAIDFSRESLERSRGAHFGLIVDIRLRTVGGKAIIAHPKVLKEATASEAYVHSSK